MVYQLAKTSPLITGQVKMNMIMNANGVHTIQYVPISNFIPFNYDNPIDVLNYTHGENIKMLYQKISDSFFTDVINPQLSTEYLHRYDTVFDDTHENTYEMGMKRLEYKRYNKQFEFFCPFWCDDIQEFENLEFEINLVNTNGRVMMNKIINFSDEISNYLKNIYTSLGYDKSKTTENKEIVYISFENKESYIKGINVTTGNIQTVDTSYIVNNMLYCERPVLELDNMIINLFSSNNIICTQLFNFNFVFDICDLLPITLLSDFLAQRINVYVDMYLRDKESGTRTKVQMKDMYSNYEFIPKYDIYTGEYSQSENVLNYLNDYKSVELIDKNKIVQSTFHWALQNNPTSIFNIYNGFSPINAGEYNCTSITNDSPDIMVDIFDENKNPFGIFKYRLHKDFFNNISLVKTYLENESNYYTLDISENGLNSKEYQFFGNILLSNKKIKEFIDDSKNRYDYLNSFGNPDYSIIAGLSDFMLFPIRNSESDTTKYSDYSNNFDFDFCELHSINGTNNTKIYDFISLFKPIKTIKCGITRIDDKVNYTMLRQVIPHNYLLTELETVINEDITIGSGSTASNFIYRACNSQNSYACLRYSDNVLYINIFFKEINGELDDVFKDVFGFGNFYDKDLIIDIQDVKDPNYNRIDNLSVTSSSGSLGMIRTGIYYSKITSGSVGLTITSTNSGSIGVAVSSDSLDIEEKYGDTYIELTTDEDLLYPSNAYPYQKYDGNSLSKRNLDYARDKLFLKSKSSGVYTITQKRIIYNALNLVASLLKCTKFPNIIVFDKSYTSSQIRNIDRECKEVELLKTDKYVNLYRYDTNLVPLFIDLDDQVFKNNVYWNKQYNKTIQNTINKNINGFFDVSINTITIENTRQKSVTYSKYQVDENTVYFIPNQVYTSNNTINVLYLIETAENEEDRIKLIDKYRVKDVKLVEKLKALWDSTYTGYTTDIDNIEKYIQQTSKKLKPLYQSIDYFTLKELDHTDYEKFYMDDYDENNTEKYNFVKEKSWYKSNSLIYLPSNFTYSFTKESNYSISEDDIVYCILLVYYSLVKIDYTNVKALDDIENLVKYYIKDLYKYEYTYDYVQVGEQSPIANQKYNIKFTLK